MRNKLGYIVIPGVSLGEWCLWYAACAGIGGALTIFLGMGS